MLLYGKCRKANDKISKSATQLTRSVLFTKSSGCFISHTRRSWVVRNDGSECGRQQFTSLRQLILMHFYPDSAWHIDVCQNWCHLNYDSWMRTVLHGTWLKNGDGTRKPLLRGTTPLLRRSVGHGFIMIYVFKMGGRSWAWSTYPFRLQNFFGIILNIRRAVSPYLPTDDVTTEEGDLKPPPPVSCFFGPFKSQIRQDIKIFEVFPMCLCVPHAYDSVLTD